MQRFSFSAAAHPALLGSAAAEGIAQRGSFMMRRFQSVSNARSAASSFLTRRTAQRYCATKGEQAAAKAAGEEVAAPRGPQRKDWRLHKDVVYMKGVPMKGSLLKLPLREQFIMCVVFSVTGSAAVFFVRPIIHDLVQKGFLGLPENSGWKNGPWLYRFLYVSIMFPCYSVLLLLCGGIFGRRVWFAFMVHKMWSRFLTKNASKRLANLLDIQHY